MTPVSTLCARIAGAAASTGSLLILAVPGALTPGTALVLFAGLMLLVRWDVRRQR